MFCIRHTEAGRTELSREDYLRDVRRRIAAQEREPLAAVHFRNTALRKAESSVTPRGRKRRPVVCLYTGKRWVMASVAAEEIGVTVTTIVNRCQVNEKAGPDDRVKLGVHVLMYEDCL